MNPHEEQREVHGHARRVVEDSRLHDWRSGLDGLHEGALVDVLTGRLELPLELSPPSSPTMWMESPASGGQTAIRPN